MGRLTVDMSDEQHQSLKALAALEGKTIKQYALERLLPRDDAEAWRELKTVLASRVEEGLAGRVSSKSVDAIVAEELVSANRA